MIIFEGNILKAMEVKFKSLSIFEFQGLFPNEDSCLKHLSELKWAEGFVCPNCGHTRYCNGSRPYERQCTSCHQRHLVPQGQVPYSQGILHCILCEYQPERHHKYGTEPKTLPTSKNVLAFQTKGDEGHEKQW